MIKNSSITYITNKKILISYMRYIDCLHLSCILICNLIQVDSYVQKNYRFSISAPGGKTVPGLHGNVFCAQRAGYVHSGCAVKASRLPGHDIS